MFVVFTLTDCTAGCRLYVTVLSEWPDRIYRLGVLQAIDRLGN